MKTLRMTVLLTYDEHLLYEPSEAGLDWFKNELTMTTNRMYIEDFDGFVGKLKVIYVEEV